MSYDFDPSPSASRRHLILGAMTIIALAASFYLAIMARRQTDVPLVLIAPVGTTVTIDGKQPRLLPNQPRAAEDLASFYFLTTAGEHEISFRRPGGAPRVQVISVAETRLPVIYTLLRDTLYEMKGRTP